MFSEWLMSRMCHSMWLGSVAMTTPRFALLIFTVTLISAQNHTSSDIHCKRPEVKTGLVLSPDEQVYNVSSNITMTCENETMTLIGQSLVNCLPSGAWDQNLPSCHDVPCPLPGDFSNGSFSLHKKAAQVIIEYVCDPNYVLLGLDAGVCTSSGSWTAPSPQCIADCGPPPELHHGLVQYNCTYVSCNMSYSCSMGYKPDKQLLINTCSDSGKWKEMPPKCLEIQCPALKDVDDVSYEASSAFSTSGFYSFNTTISFQCNETLQIEGAKSVTCMEDGTWSNDTPKCITMVTPEDPNKESPSLNATQTPLPPDGTSSNRSTNASIHLITENPSTAVNMTETIGKNATESAPGNKVTCPQLKAFPHGHYHTYGNHNKAMVKFECDHGFHLNGSYTLECQADGTWSGVIPTCSSFDNFLPSTTTSETPTSWLKAFRQYDQWRGEYLYRKEYVGFKLHVTAVHSDSLNALIHDDETQFEVTVSKKAPSSANIVIQLQQVITKESKRFPKVDWMVEGRLNQSDCLWYYTGRIWSPIDGFGNLTMHPVNDNWDDIRNCGTPSSTAAVVAGITIATIGVVIVVIVAIYCTKKRGGLHSYGHKSLTSFENPVYEYEHGLK